MQTCDSYCRHLTPSYAQLLVFPKSVFLSLLCDTETHTQEEPYNECRAVDGFKRPKIYKNFHWVLS